MGGKIVLITGGMGYLGSLVAERLPGSYIIDHKAGNAIDEDTLDKYLPKVSHVIHLAGTHYAFSAFDCFSDLAAFILLCRQKRGRGVNHLVLASSAAVYGNDGGIINEDRQPNPCTPYGRYKLMCEQIAVDCEMDTVIIRPFNASGGLAKFIPNVKSGKVTIFGDGTAVRDFVHAEDVADAFVAALNVRRGIFNIGSGVGITLNEIVALRKNVKVDFQAERENDPKVLVADITKAKTVLGWTPTRTIEDILC